MNDLIKFINGFYEKFNNIQAVAGLINLMRKRSPSPSKELFLPS